MMTSGIEAEMARFEEEVLGSDQRSRRGPPGPGIPDLPPPPFMQSLGHHGNFDNMPMMPGPGPMPGHNDMMRGPGPMPGLGPGPMMMMPGGMAKPKVYSAPPQITKAPQVEKRKVDDQEVNVPTKILAKESAVSSSNSSETVSV